VVSAARRGRAAAAAAAGSVDDRVMLIDQRCSSRV